MKSLTSSLIVVSSLGLILLGACSNSNQAANPDNNSATTNSAESPAPTNNETNTESSTHAAVPQAGGQVIESGAYHLEFVSEPEANGTHLDFYLQKSDNHAAIPNANVTAQVQLPDGTSRKLNMTYDAAGKHYAALLPENAAGEYKVAILTQVNGEKVNGRFTFNR